MNRPIEKEYVLGKIYGLADDIKDTPTIEPCEDAISRAWVKENMLKYGFLAPDMTVTEFVEDAPLVAPSRPSGEWKEVYAETDYRNGWIEFSCECCGHQHGLESGEYGWSYGEPIPWKFCPLCGAKMKGE